MGGCGFSEVERETPKANRSRNANHQVWGGRTNREGVGDGNCFADPDSGDEKVSQEVEDEGSGEEDGREVQDTEEDTGRFEDADSDEEDKEATTLQQKVLSGYHAKRDVIFQPAQEAGVGAHPVRSGGGSGPPKVSYDDEFVPLDATSPTNPHPTSGTGTPRLKSSHTGQPHSATVRAIGPDAHETIREGKLVDGQLVASADGGSDPDGLTETGKQALDRHGNETTTTRYHFHKTGLKKARNLPMPRDPQPMRILLRPPLD
ncbi:hypothetical protein FRC01_008906 [Tulasnella sp. 417]|nr:hypothetical protein FRC01_008906 [Tulasnella sp. 417]